MARLSLTVGPSSGWEWHAGARQPGVLDADLVGVCSGGALWDAPCWGVAWLTEDERFGLMVTVRSGALWWCRLDPAGGAHAGHVPGSLWSDEGGVVHYLDHAISPDSGLERLRIRIRAGRLQWGAPDGVGWLDDTSSSSLRDLPDFTKTCLVVSTNASHGAYVSGVLS